MAAACTTSQILHLKLCSSLLGIPRHIIDVDLATISELFPYKWEHVYTDAVKLDTLIVICSSCKTTE